MVGDAAGELAEEGGGQGAGHLGHLGRVDLSLLWTRDAGRGVERPDLFRGDLLHQSSLFQELLNAQFPPDVGVLDGVLTPFQVAEVVALGIVSVLAEVLGQERREYV